MTKYYKIVSDGFVIGFGTNGNDSTVPLTKKEYNDLASFFATKPEAPVNHKYIMRDTPREWVLVEVPPVPDEITDSEALEIILGGMTL